MFANQMLGTRLRPFASYRLCYYLQELECRNHLMSA
jgi:hypothetical protein